MASESETQRITRLTPLADVLARIDALVQRVEPREASPRAAIGRVLARDVIAASRPATATALRDGWAVRADLTTDASAYAPAPVPGAQQVDAGDLLPAGADAVAPLDAVAVRGGTVEIAAPVAVGEGMLPVGGDTGIGEALLREGGYVTALRADALAAAGVDRVTVREPRVCLMRARPGHDAVIDAALSFIAVAIGVSGSATIRGESFAPGEIDALLTDQRLDAIIVVGGTGSGRYDASVRALARAGRVEVHGIGLSPGETAAFGFVGTRPVLLLPGRLDAALAGWLTLGRHMVRRLSAGTKAAPTTAVVLTRKIASPLGLAEVVPMRCCDGKAEPIASGYLPLQALLQADGWILVPADSEGYPAGAEVVVKPWL